MMKTTSFRGYVKVIGFNALLFAAALLLLEGVCRWVGIPYKTKGAWTPGENAIAQFDAELGWAYIPGLSKTIAASGASWDAHFDQRGIRVPSPDFTLDPARSSVLFIGCSFTMGHGLSYHENFVGKFAAIPQNPWQAVNLGVQAYGADQAYLALKKFLPVFNAKFVVYTFIAEHVLRVGNYDRRLLLPDANFIGTKPLFGLTEQNELRLLKKPLRYSDYHHSFLLDALTVKIGARLGAFPPFPKELTQRLMLEMNKASEARGARFLVLNWRWTPDEYEDIFHGLEVEKLDTLTNAPPRWEFMRMFQDGGHPNAAAGDHAARLIFEHLRRSERW